jgi:O-methyltransferase involved in polyketide biosynthesis
MLKLIAAIVGLGILGMLVFSWMDSAGGLPADPVTSSVSLDLKVKAQADVSITVTSLSNRIKQTMAAGNDPAQRSALTKDIAALHAKVDAAREQLIALGDQPAAVDQWLDRVGWPAFQQLEAEYRKANGE